MPNNYTTYLKIPVNNDRYSMPLFTKKRWINNRN